MCTVTILQNEGRTLVTMNRDEARFRGPEGPPRLHADAGSPVWAGPVDSDSGGTWMGVNDRGCIACLLNRYAPGDSDPARLLPGHRSRGLIVPEVLAQPDAAAASTHLRTALNPVGYGSFTLVLVTPQGAHAFEWAYGDGLVEHALDAPWALLTSSALDTAAVLAWRRAQFEAWLEEGAVFDGALPAFHTLHPAGKEGWAPLMDRAISATRSITQVEVSAAGIRLRYWPREEGQTAFDDAAAVETVPLHEG